MLDSIYIRNYRTLENLSIGSLGRVNLIIGKNNTGKTTLLEAIGIYATKGDFSFISQIFEERGESSRKRDTNEYDISNNLEMLRSLFTNRTIKFNLDSAIVIGTQETSLLEIQKTNDQSVTLRLVLYSDEVQRNAQGVRLNRKSIVADSDLSEVAVDIYEHKVGFEINTGSRSVILPIESLPGRSSLQPSENKSTLQLIRTFNIDRNINGRLWDNITLTEKESHVIEALRIIEPLTERIAFKESSSSSRERTTIIKLSNVDTPIPLKSMGDGINRILTIILALVNADNGFLLIDEFENGLHYSVQEKLWEIIFKLSQKLNVQVFVTTHSEDCIVGFETILNDSDNPLEGKLIRLENINGKIKQVEFDAKELKIATDNDIEIR
ncbi:MAG: AAA family ATPase [Spirosomataceae bacterium]